MSNTFEHIVKQLHKSEIEIEQEEYKIQLHQHLQQRISDLQQPKQQSIFSILSSFISNETTDKQIIIDEKKEIFKEILLLSLYNEPIDRYIQFIIDECFQNDVYEDACLTLLQICSNDSTNKIREIVQLLLPNGIEKVFESPLENKQKSVSLLKLLSLIVNQDNYHHFIEKCIQLIKLQFNSETSMIIKESIKQLLFLYQFKIDEKYHLLILQRIIELFHECILKKQFEKENDLIQSILSYFEILSSTNVHSEVYKQPFQEYSSTLSSFLFELLSHLFFKTSTTNEQMILSILKVVLSFQKLQIDQKQQKILNECNQRYSFQLSNDLHCQIFIYYLSFCTKYHFELPILTQSLLTELDNFYSSSNSYKHRLFLKIISHYEYYCKQHQKKIYQLFHSNDLLTSFNAFPLLSFSYLLSSECQLSIPLSIQNYHLLIHSQSSLIYITQEEIKKSILLFIQTIHSDTSLNQNDKQILLKFINDCFPFIQ